MSAEQDVQAVYDRGHSSIGGSPFCLADPCPWHPGETRLHPPRPFSPVVLVTGDPSLVVVNVAEFCRAQHERKNP